MKRSQFVLAALLCVGMLPGSSLAANAWFSLNLEFNNPADFNSGGTWTAVGKADERGFAGIVLRYDATSLNFNPATGFLAPPEFDIRMSQIGPMGWLEIVQGFGFNTPVVDIGVIGGTYASTYADDPNLVIFGTNLDLGTFTGGVELATGSFDPGDIPTWFPAGPEQTGAALLTGPSLPAIPATVFTTVRYVVPEPATMLLAGLSLLSFVVRRR